MNKLAPRKSNHYSTGQQRMLGYAALVSLVIGIIFFAPFFGVIATSLILAYTFLPINNWFHARLKRPALAPALTLLSATLLLIIPIVIISTLTFYQAQQLYQDVRGDEALITRVNDAVQGSEAALRSATGDNISLNTDEIVDAASSAAATAANTIVRSIGTAVSNIPLLFSSIVLFFYLFLATLRYQKEIIDYLRKINPLDDALLDSALTKAGAMTNGMVRGQFLIALVQGGIGALSYAIAGVPLIAFFFVVLSFLSLIPLGSGILSFPIGVILLLTGNVWQGLVVLLVHLVIVSNIDNVLRPSLIPKEARLPSALTLLGVFAGLATFGFLGLIVGPVLLILILTILDTYGDVNTRQKKTA